MTHRTCLSPSTVYDSQNIPEPIHCLWLTEHAWAHPLSMTHRTCLSPSTVYDSQNIPEPISHSVLTKGREGGMWPFSKLALYLASWHCIFLQPGAHVHKRTRTHTHHRHPYTMSTGSFPEVQGPGRGVISPPLPSVEIAEGVELHLYSNSVPS